MQSFPIFDANKATVLPKPGVEPGFSDTNLQIEGGKASFETQLRDATEQVDPAPYESNDRIESEPKKLRESKVKQSKSQAPSQSDTPTEDASSVGQAALAPAQEAQKKEKPTGSSETKPSEPDHAGEKRSDLVSSAEPARPGFVSGGLPESIKKTQVSLQKTISVDPTKPISTTVKPVSVSQSTLSAPPLSTQSVLVENTRIENPQFAGLGEASILSPEQASGESADLPALAPLAVPKGLSGESAEKMGLSEARLTDESPSPVKPAPSQEPQTKALLEPATQATSELIATASNTPTPAQKSPLSVSAAVPSHPGLETDSGATLEAAVLPVSGGLETQSQSGQSQMSFDQQPGFSFSQGGSSEGVSQAAVSKTAASFQSRLDAIQQRPEETQVLRQVATELRSFRPGQNQSLRFLLDPKELGRIQIDVIFQENGVSARFLTSDPAVKEILEGNQSYLKQNLTDQGLNMGSFSVDVGDMSQDDQTRFSGFDEKRAEVKGETESETNEGPSTTEHRHRAAMENGQLSVYV